MPGSKIVKTQGLLQSEDALVRFFETLPKDGLSTYRAQAQKQFRRAGLPTRKNEDWQFTPLDGLSIPPHYHAEKEQDIDIAPPPVEVDAPCIIIAGGTLRLPADSAGLTFQTGTAPAAATEVGGDIMYTVNRACLQQQANVHITAPVTLYVRFQSPQVASSFTHIHLHIAAQVEATVIELHEKGHAGSFSSCTLSADVQPNAALRHYKWQGSDDHGQHFAQNAFGLERDARLESVSVLAGSSICRHNSIVSLLGEGARSQVNSLYLGSGRRIVDTRTTTRHLAPGCTSYQIHKGVLDDRSKGVFQGCIHVDKSALKTDGQMDNRALILSPQAENNSKPQLQIYADDVKCSHGFTCGELDKDQLFYLRTRGIPRKQARRWLIYAFAAEVTEIISHDAMRRTINQSLLQ